jgi:hypothetical protein
MEEKVREGDTIGRIGTFPGRRRGITICVVASTPEEYQWRLFTI